MGEVLVVLAVILVVTTLATAAAALFVRWWLRRRNRVSPEHPTLAPLWWLAWPTRFAMMHRRLRALTGVARALAAASPAVADMAASIETQAVGLDRRVVLSSRIRHKRLETYAVLEAQVTELEAVTLRLSELMHEASEPARLPGDRPPLAQLGERLDALEAARTELGRLEQDKGLAPIRRPAT